MLYNDFSDVNPNEKGGEKGSDTNEISFSYVMQERKKGSHSLTEGPETYHFVPFGLKGKEEKNGYKIRGSEHPNV